MGYSFQNSKHFGPAEPILTYATVQINILRYLDYAFRFLVTPRIHSSGSISNESWGSIRVWIWWMKQYTEYRKGTLGWYARATRTGNGDPRHLNFVARCDNNTRRHKLTAILSGHREALIIARLWSCCLYNIAQSFHPRQLRVSTLFNYTWFIAFRLRLNLLGKTSTLPNITYIDVLREKNVIDKPVVIAHKRGIFILFLKYYTKNTKHVYSQTLNKRLPHIV